MCLLFRFELLTRDSKHGWEQKPVRRDKRRATRVPVDIRRFRSLTRQAPPESGILSEMGMLRQSSHVFSPSS